MSIRLSFVIGMGIVVLGGCNSTQTVETIPSSCGGNCSELEKRHTANWGPITVNLAASGDKISSALLAYDEDFKKEKERIVSAMWEVSCSHNCYRKAEYRETHSMQFFGVEPTDRCKGSVETSISASVGLTDLSNAGRKFGKTSAQVKEVLDDLCRAENTNTACEATNIELTGIKSEGTLMVVYTATASAACGEGSGESSSIASLYGGADTTVRCQKHLCPDGAQTARSASKTGESAGQISKDIQAVLEDPAVATTGSSFDSCVVGSIPDEL